jgi:hypothetical protein
MGDNASPYLKKIYSQVLPATAGDWHSVSEGAAVGLYL